MLKRKFVIGIGLFVIIGIGYVSYQKLSDGSDSVRYVTATAERGTLVSSISGSGQVNVSDLVNIRPKVSGEVRASYVAQGQAIETGALLVQLNANDAWLDVQKAETDLETAKLKLRELLSPADELDLLQAESALRSAQRNLDRAQRDYENLQEDPPLVRAYEDAYTEISSAFFGLPDYMGDLQNVLGTGAQPRKHVGAYELILPGSSGFFVDAFLNDYSEARLIYEKILIVFRETRRDADAETIYRLLSDTLNAADSVAQTLQSAQTMYGAIITRDYQQLDVSSVINSMNPEIKSDIGEINSIVNRLQDAQDIIDDVTQDAPSDLEDALDAIEDANIAFRQKEILFTELQDGVDDLDIRTQEIIVRQKEQDLASARQRLADHSIRAPFDGIIAEIEVRNGDFVSSGSSLLTIITKQKLAEITLNEIDVSKVVVGQPATLTFDAVEDITLTGRVAEIDVLGATTQGVVTYNVRIAFDTQDERVRPGMTTDASIVTDRKDNVVLVPNAAVQVQGGQIFVEVMRGGITQRVAVEVGLSNEVSTEIVSGLSGDTEVVTARLGGESSIQNTAAISQPFGFPSGGSGGGFRGGGGFAH